MFSQKLIVYGTWVRLPGEMICHIARFISHEDLISFFLIKRSILPDLHRFRFYELKCGDLTIQVTSAKDLLINKMTMYTKCDRCPKTMTWGTRNDGAYSGGWLCNYCRKSCSVSEERYMCIDCMSDKCTKCHKLLQKGRVNALRLRCEKCERRVELGNNSGFYNRAFNCHFCSLRYRSNVTRYQCKACNVDYCLDCISKDPSERVFSAKEKEKKNEEDEKEEQEQFPREFSIFNFLDIISTNEGVDEVVDDGIRNILFDIPDIQTNREESSKEEDDK